MNIEIDLDVRKALTQMLESEQETFNGVLRRILNLNGTPISTKAEVPSVFQGLSESDVRFFADSGDASEKAELVRRGLAEDRPAISDMRHSGEPNSASFDPAPERGNWTTKGVPFPAGTEFRANYKGQTINGHVESGALVVNGKVFHSPSAAAVSITGYPVNGWRFWECRIPGQSSWKILESLRK